MREKSTLTCYFTVVSCLNKNRASGKTSVNEAGLLTPALVHAPGLRPDLEGVRFPLERPIGCRGVKGGQGGQDGQWLGGRRRHRWRAPQGVRGHDGLRAAGRVCVCAAVTAYAVLRAALTVLPFQLLRDAETYRLRPLHTIYISSIGHQHAVCLH